MKLKQIALLALLMVASIVGKSQTGLIKGTITDANTKESLIGATVVIQGTSKGASTDFDGNYKIDKIKAGSYNLVISYISYDNQIIRVDVAEGKETELNIALKSATLNIDEVKVTAKRRDNTEVSMISSIKSSNLIVSGITAQQIGKSQDKDAAEVIRRVPGITITDGRFVIVRGLIERYNSVMLNGSSAPSFEADKRAFSFDAIPSGMIDNILIYKSPAPELPADFAGAAINVETKSNADENSLVISYATKYVENTTFNRDFHTYNGGKTDWLGFDDGTRNIPTGIPSSSDFTELYNWSDLNDYLTKTSKLVEISKKFSNNWETKSKNPFPDQNLSITLQRRFVFGKVSLGNISSLNYSNSNDLLNIKRIEYQDYSESQGTVIKDFDFQDQKNKESSKIGFIHNWNLLYGNNQKLEFRNFVNQMGNKTTGIREGINYYNVETIRLYDLKYETRFVYSGQLAGEQKFNQNRSKLNWMIGYGLTKNKQPDNRRLTFVLNEDTQSEYYNQYYMRIQNVSNVYLGGRLWLDLDEKVFDYKADFEQQFKLLGSKSDYTFKAGISAQKKNRSFSSRLIGTVAVKGLSNDLIYKSANEIFDEDNIYFDQTLPLTEGGFSYRDNTSASDSYDAEDNLLCAYFGLKIPFTSKLNLYGGVRFEKFKRLISNFYVETGNTDDLNIKRDTLNYFPSANLTYNINEKNLLRLSYGKTINRPEFREMSNFVYQDFDMFLLVHGNEDLKNSYIDNYDLRYEWYPSNGEIISLAGFYKKFTNPIEVFLIYAGTGFDYKPYNTENGYSAGIELDVRKRFSEFEHSSGVLGALKNLTVIFNTSLIKSEINTEQAFAREKYRIMQGQSPYILNFGLNYQSENKGFNMSLNYNLIGKRIVFVGTPDHPHTWELPRNSLDLTIEKNIGKRVAVKAGIKDILNQPLRYVEYFGPNDNIEVDSYRYTPNRNYSLGFVFKL